MKAQTKGWGVMGVLVCILFTCHLVRGEIFSFDRKYQGLGRDDCSSEETSSLHFRIGVFAPNEAPASGFTQTPAIQVDLATPDPLESIIYHSSQKDLIGVKNEDDDVYLCCTPVLLAKTEGTPGCKDASDVGNIIINKSDKAYNESLIKYERLSSSYSVFDPIYVSGFYYVEITNCQCDTTDDQDAKAIGTVQFINTYGHLSAELYPFYPFWGVLMFNYILLGCFWAVLSAIHWNEILQLQNYIGGVIFLGVIECAIWSYDYHQENHYGYYQVFYTIIGILADTIKRTISRVLLLAVSMGYGVVKPTLGSDGYKVIFIGVLFFSFLGTFQFLEQFLRRVHYHSNSADGDVVESVESIFIFPVALLDTLFYWWIGVSLVRTFGQLTVRKQTVKLNMYKKFFIGLVVSAFASGFMMFYQLWVAAGFVDDEAKWATSWVWLVFWNIVYFILLLLVAILWRPQENNTRYAYNKNEDGGEGTGEVQGKGLGGLFETVAKRVGGEEEEERKGTGGDGRREVVEVEMLDMPIPTFTIESDEEDETKLE